MSKSALTMLPILFALTACTPPASSTETADDGNEAAAAAAAEPGDPSTPDLPDHDMPGHDMPGHDTSASSGASEGGAPPAGGPPEPTVIAGPGLDESCDASKVQDVVGKKPEQAVVEDAVARSGAKTVRVIPHDGMVTMDYRGDRLNLQLDESGTIVTATCG